MHTFIRAAAIYASISTVASAFLFVFYLEVYTWLTKQTLTNYDPLSWRNLLPIYSMWIMVVSGFLTACATILSVFL